jgi:hypothetical protein
VITIIAGILNIPELIQSTENSADEARGKLSSIIADILGIPEFHEQQHKYYKYCNYDV